jgi:hypothetical protein
MPRAPGHDGADREARGPASANPADQSLNSFPDPTCSECRKIIWPRVLADRLKSQLSGEGGLTPLVIL